MQDASSNLDASGKKGKDIIDSFGDALVSNFSVGAVGKVVAELDKGASLLLKQFGVCKYCRVINTSRPSNLKVSDDFVEVTNNLGVQ